MPEGPDTRSALHTGCVPIAFRAIVLSKMRIVLKRKTLKAPPGRASEVFVR
jgi:hypothetical protein